MPYGNWLAYAPLVLAGLALLFVLCHRGRAVAALAQPRRRRRGLAARLPMVALAAPLCQTRGSGCPARACSTSLARCGAVALGAGRTAGPGRARSWLRWPQRCPRVRVVRLLGVLAVALALVYVMVCVSRRSGRRHLCGHGGRHQARCTGLCPTATCPETSFTGTPIRRSATSPTRPWRCCPRSARVGLGRPRARRHRCVAVAIGAALACRARSAAVARVCAEPQAALAWLAFPTLLVTVSSGTTDVALAAMLLGAVALRRRPVTACALIAAAGYFKLAPFLLLPLWLAPLRGRQLAHALLAVAAVSIVALGPVLALGGAGALPEMLHAISYQFARGSEQSFPAVLPFAGLQPLLEALVLATVCAATTAIARRGEALDTRRLSALTVLILIGLQLSANYWSVLYLAWLAPGLLVALLLQPEPAAATALARHPRLMARPAAVLAD